MVTTSVYAVCAIEAGDASLLAGRIPALLAACQRPTAATGLMRRYQPRTETLRPAAEERPAEPLNPATGSPAWSPARRPVSAVSGMGHYGSPIVYNVNRFY